MEMKYGFKPDLGDHRDLYYKPSLWNRLLSLVGDIDLRPQCPPIYNQLQESSCTANAICGMDEFVQMKEKLPDTFQGSRNFLYWNERALHGETGVDNGAQLRDGMKVLNKYGVCPETTWKYGKDTLFAKPSAEVYAEALKHPSVTYMRLQQDVSHMKACLKEGYPFVFGFTVFPSFESQETAQTGIVKMPSKTEGGPIGGHAVMACGWLSRSNRFVIRNSWGAWGLNQSGYCLMPAAYLANSDLASDFWTLRVTK